AHRARDVVRLGPGGGRRTAGAGGDGVRAHPQKRRESPLPAAQSDGRMVGIAASVDPIRDPRGWPGLGIGCAPEEGGRRLGFGIRPANGDDGPAYVALVRALAEFEKLPGPTDEAAARLCEHAFGSKPSYELLVAEVAGEVVGYAVYFHSYSTFLARPSL